MTKVEEEKQNGGKKRKANGSMVLPVTHVFEFPALPFAIIVTWDQQKENVVEIIGGPRGGTSCRRRRRGTENPRNSYLGGRPADEKGQYDKCGFFATENNEKIYAREVENREEKGKPFSF